MNKNESHRGRTFKVALTAASILVGMAGAAVAAPEQTPTSAGHAACLFAIVWFIASLRVRKSNGRWAFGFELSPIGRLVEPRRPVSATEGRVS